MTPEEIAERIADKWQQDDIRGEDHLIADIATAIRDAYERAAKRVWLGGNPDDVFADILRMRDGKPPIEDGEEFWMESLASGSIP